MFPWKTPFCAAHCAGLTPDTQLPSGKQQAPIGKHTYPVQVCPVGPGTPPAATQDAGGSVRHPPVAAKQHGAMFCEQVVEVQVVPSPPKVPDCDAHALAESTWHEPFGRQHVPGNSQFTGVHVQRMTQSPLGRQPVGSCEKFFQPAGQPSAPQFKRYNQLRVGACSPPTSVVGNALELEGGAIRQGFCV